MIETVFFSMHSGRRKSCRNFKVIDMSANSMTSTTPVTTATQSVLFKNICPLASKLCKTQLTAKKGASRLFSSRSVNQARRKRARQNSKAVLKHLDSLLRSKSKIS